MSTFILPMVQPYLLNSPAGARYAETSVRDLKLAKALLSRKPNWSEKGSLVFPTLAQIKTLIAEVRASREALVIDLETIGGHPMNAQIRCAGIGYSKRAVVCWFLAEGGVSYWKNPRDYRAMINLLKDAFSDASLPKLGQNIVLFDHPVIENAVNELGPLRGEVSDIMFMHHVTDSELPHGLDYLTSRYTECAYYKSMVADPDAKGNEKWATIKSEILGDYNVKDVLCTARAAPPIRRTLSDWPRAKELYEKELRVAGELRLMSEKGLRVDRTRQKELVKSLVATEEKYLGYMRKTLQWKDFNPNSHMQVAQALFGKLKFPILNTRDARTKKGKPSTGKQALFELSLRVDAGSQNALFLRAVTAYRKARKLRGTYVEVDEHIFPDGRIHPSWRLLTKSGRFAATPAVNTLPKAIKSLYIAGEGNEFAATDLSQAELRAIAFLADVKMLLEAYESGVDVHCFNAVKIFEVCPPPGFEKWNLPTEALLDKYQPGWREFEVDPAFKATRELTKRGVFASNYMAQLETVWRSLRAETDDKTGDLIFPDLPKSQVEAFMIAWFRAAPEIPRFAQSRLLEAQDQGYYECPVSGRRRYYKDKLDLSDAANQPVQILVASHMNEALLRMGPYIRKLGCHIVSQVHDAMVLEGPKGIRIREAAKIMQEEMSQPIKVGNRFLTIPADPPKFGQSLAAV